MRISSSSLGTGTKLFIEFSMDTPLVRQGLVSLNNALFEIVSDLFSENVGDEEAVEETSLDLLLDESKAVVIVC